MSFHLISEWSGSLKLTRRLKTIQKSLISCSAWRDLAGADCSSWCTVRTGKVAACFEVFWKCAECEYHYGIFDNFWRTPRGARRGLRTARSNFQFITERAYCSGIVWTLCWCAEDQIFVPLRLVLHFDPFRLPISSFAWKLLQRAYKGSFTPLNL